MKTGTVAAGLLGGVLVIGGAALVLGGRAISQPIEFNHSLHVNDAEIECTHCHVHARDGVRATIPNIAICAECHEEPSTKSPNEARLIEHIRDSTAVPWRKINVLPDHVYFSHRRHTAVAGIECEVCHGNVKQQVRSLRRPLKKISMDRCIGCHAKAGVSTDCVACHQ